MNELVETKWYKHLIKNIDELYVETKFNMGEDLVHYYHNLGELIVENHGNFEREKVYGKNILERVRTSLAEINIKYSVSTLYRVKQFYTQHPDWEVFKTTFNTNKKGIVWHDVCKALPLPKDLQEVKEKDEYKSTIDSFTKKIEGLQNKFTGDLVILILKEVKYKCEYWIETIGGKK